MLTRTTLAAALMLTATLPAWAQYPPPGLYACALDKLPLGTLLLQEAGDYSFSVDGKPDDPGNGSGQLASAGTSVHPISGPFADVYKVEGFFKTNDVGTTIFSFSTPDKKVLRCEPVKG